MRLGFIAAIALLTMLGACSRPKPVIVNSPYGSGTTHSEPVFYNGKHYKLSFKYIAVKNLYDVSIIGKGGRKLGSKPGDAKIVGEVVSSAIRHFTCATGQKAHILPGSQRNLNGRWHMYARCG